MKSVTHDKFIEAVVIANRMVEAKLPNKFIAEALKLAGESLVALELMRMWGLQCWDEETNRAEREANVTAIQDFIDNRPRRSDKPFVGGLVFFDNIPDDDVAVWNGTITTIGSDEAVMVHVIAGGVDPYIFALVFSPNDGGWSRCGRYKRKAWSCTE